MFKPLFTSGSLFLKGVDILLENLFKLKENGTNAKTEMMAGITTFMTMAYILAVNPAILSASGMDSGAVFTATAIASCIGTLFMAFFANYPFALAPGMGLNAFFAYTVVGQMGYSWQVALAAVFVEGILFFILSLTKVREAIFNCIPFSLKYGVTGGIGLFIAFIGLQNSHLVVDGATLVSIYPFKASLASGEFYTTGIGALLALYAAFALLLGLGGYLIAPRTIDSITRLVALVERCMDKMTFEQQVGSISGLVGGFIIAALLSQLVMLMGASMFTVAMCAILFVVFGVLGVTLGIRRAADFKRMFQRFSPKGNKQVALSHRKIKTAKPKLLDETVLIDGRIAAVCRAGFLEGTLLISRSVEKELQRLSASEEETCRIRGEKGRETLSQLEALGRVKRVDSAAGGELAQVLLADAKKHHMVIVTCDAAMSRAAEKAGVAALNLNDLACALRPTVQMGDLLDVRIVKAGREATQGVGYTPDGTMVVVEGGRDAVGQVLHVQVSSVLQTNAGRMIFAKKV